MRNEVLSALWKSIVFQSTCLPAGGDSALHRIKPAIRTGDMTAFFISCPKLFWTVNTVFYKALLDPFQWKTLPVFTLIES